MKIDLQECKTSAQAMIKLGFNEATRNLQFRVNCEDLSDLRNCVSLINEYNSFNWITVNKAIDSFLSDKHHSKKEYLLDFDIGREFKPVLYVKCWAYDISKQDFVKKMETFMSVSGANECEFNFETPVPDSDQFKFRKAPALTINRFECRICWNN